MTIHSQSGASAGAPMVYCEYADGANNNLGVDLIPRVPTLADAIVALQTPRSMGIGGSLDCDAGQTLPPTGTVTEIWGPAPRKLTPRSTTCGRPSPSAGSPPSPSCPAESEHDEHGMVGASPTIP